MFLELKVTASLAAARANIASFRVPAAGTFDVIKFFSDTTVDGGNAIFDVNINGTSIWNADQTQRPKILDGDATVTKSSIAASVAEDDLVSIDFDGFSAGTPTVGGQLVIVITITESGGAGSPSGAWVSVDSPPSDINITTSTWTIVPFDNIESDQGGYYDGTNKAIVLPADGFYWITAQITIEANASGVRKIGLAFEDGSSPSSPTRILEMVAPNLGGSVPVTIQLKHLVSPDQALAGYRYQVEAWQDSGSTLKIQPSAGAIKKSWIQIAPCGKQ